MKEKQLIDAAELEKYIVEWKKSLDKNPIGGYSYAIATDTTDKVLSLLLDRIKYMPKVRLHGGKKEPIQSQKWEYATDRLYVTIVDGRKLQEPAVKCSGCGAFISESDYLRYIWNYCPVCGAKMEDGTDDTPIL